MNLKFPSAQNVIIEDGFWSPRMEIVRTQGIPYQYEALLDHLLDAEPSRCVTNFRIAAGLEKGEHHGYQFQDSDLAKWLEAVGFSLMRHRDADLEKKADDLIDLIAAAQREDGYLSTYYILGDMQKRFTNLTDHHELYIAGHMIEAGCAYYTATGKRKLLDVCLRLVDCIDSAIGPEEGKLHGYPGHPVLEMALVRLYEITHDEKHLRMAKYFIDERGREPLYFREEVRTRGEKNHWEDGPLGYGYYQADEPVRSQKEAKGHAVRALYLYSGMADVARETEDAELFEACRRLWKNMVRRRMYITGGVGSSEYGEAFTYDYDLPNDTVYAETCASIALVFFARRMLRLEPNAEYADVMEKALYNGVISGMDLDGRRFFYVNPLEVVPEACEKDWLRHHVAPERQKWFGCACCPPNLMRLLASLGEYIVMQSDDRAWVNLYIGSTTALNGGGTLKISTDYPMDGHVSVRLEGVNAEKTLALRIPAWCPRFILRVNGVEVSAKQENGYALVKRMWSDTDEVTLVLGMPVTLMRANPMVREDMGLVCVTRGPIVYCAEEADNGKNLHLLRIDPKTAFTLEREDDLGGIVRITCAGTREQTWDTDELYAPYKEPQVTPCTLSLIPYSTWANRGVGEMRVFLHV